MTYHADVPAKRAAGTKPRGAFDLRDVSTMRPSSDPSAPPTALELVVRKHAFTLSFTTEAERDAFLKIWVNGVPSAAVTKPPRKMEPASCLVRN